MKRVLITGASRGIGAAIALELSQFEELELITPSRDEFDLADANSVDNFLKETAPFDCIVNNAGINLIKNLEDITSRDIQKINSVNLEAPLKIIQHSAAHMKSQGFGRIVNIGSIWSIRSKESRTLYSGSKFGLLGYTKALARELGPFNVLINTVCPGFIDTELTKKSLTSEEREKLINEVPLRRLGEPAEIAGLVVFLIMKNSFITGQAIVIDGGFTA